MTWLSLAGNWRVWAGLAVAGLMLAVYVQTVRLDGCKAELRAERDRVRVLGAQIEAQNAAVASLEAEGRARVAEATAALALARREGVRLQQSLQSLSDALQAADERPELTQASACPAGDAVQEVRRALAR